MNLFVKMIDMDDRDKLQPPASASSSKNGLNGSFKNHSLFTNGLKGSVSNEEALRVLVEKLTEQNQHLEKQISELKFEFDRFTQNLAKSVKTPFRNIVALTEGLVRNCSGSLGGYGQGYCDNIIYSADAVEKIMIDLFQYHRLGTTDIEMTEFDLGTLINQVFNDTRKQIEYRNVSIDVDINSVKVYSSRTIFYQIFYQLILYNLDNINQDGKLCIRFSTQNSQGEPKLFIYSNGKTIDPPILDLLNSENGEFGFFEQGDQSGIGLSIARKGCKLLNLMFGAEVKPGEGNLFWIEFNPYNIVEDKKE